MRKREHAWDHRSVGVTSGDSLTFKSPTWRAYATLSRRTLLAAAWPGSLGVSASRAAEAPPGKTKFAVNAELVVAAACSSSGWRGGPPRFPGRRVLAVARQGHQRRGRDVRAAQLMIAQFTALGLQAGAQRPEEPRPVRRGDRKELRGRRRSGMHAHVRGRRRRHPGRDAGEMHENIIEGLKKAAPVAEKHGVTLILEPMNIRVDHKGHCLYGTAPTLRIIKAVNSKNVKILWDLYHMHITEGDLCGHLNEGFEATLGYLQVADHPGRNEPGTGEINYPRSFRQLHDAGLPRLRRAGCRPLKMKGGGRGRGAGRRMEEPPMPTPIASRPSSPSTAATPTPTRSSARSSRATSTTAARAQPAPGLAVRGPVPAGGPQPGSGRGPAPGPGLRWNRSTYSDTRRRFGPAPPSWWYPSRILPTITSACVCRRYSVTTAAKLCLGVSHHSCHHTSCLRHRPAASRVALERPAFEADVAAIAQRRELLEHARIVDLAGARLVAAGVVGDLDVARRSRSSPAGGRTGRLR